MDQEKLRRMGELEYVIVDSCMTCIHREKERIEGRVRVPTGWGLCMAQNYIHEKQGIRSMPSHPGMRCKLHERDPEVGRELGQYATSPWRHPKERHGSDH